MPSSSAEPVSVLFVCLGNICRSPMAEAVFADLVNRRGLSSHFARIDSCGTGGYHEGEPADERTIAVCKQNGVPITCRARRLEIEDFNEFDHIIGMDANNVRSLRSSAPRSSKASIHLFGDFGDGKPIADPYYGGAGGFNRTFEQCKRYSEGFLQYLGLGDAGSSGA